MLFKLISEEAGDERISIVATAALSGLANAAVLAVVNVALRTKSPGFDLFLLFLAACGLFALSLNYCVTKLSTLVETTLHKIRLRIADKIRKAELESLEQIGTAEIYERLTQETTVISQAAWPVALGIQSALLMVFVALYILQQSAVSFLIILALYGGGAFVFHNNNLRVKQFMRDAAALQMSLFDRLNDLLHGFKELRLRALRSVAVYKDYEALSSSLHRDMVRIHVLNKNNYVFGNFNMFAVLAAVVFVLPQFFTDYTQVMYNLNAAILFMFGVLGSLLWALPYYGRANLAAEHIFDLEGKLEQKLKRTPDEETDDPWHGQFQELRADDLQFQYSAETDQTPFSVGPLSLRIRAGEIVFIVGGNGSGKTTLLRLLTGLYHPTAGTLNVNGEPLEPGNVDCYQEMIAAVFGDFHLFKKLYGLPNASAEEVQRLLEKMQIAHKTSFKNGSLTTLRLSTGQRKRLAMVVALLEDRPIYVFDEWAADQDPEFRHYYYEELLPELKQRGKTIIAISHDDRYFHCADHVITMEYGQVRSDVQGDAARVLLSTLQSSPSPPDLSKGKSERA